MPGTPALNFRCPHERLSIRRRGLDDPHHLPRTAVADVSARAGHQLVDLAIGPSAERAAEWSEPHTSSLTAEHAEHAESSFFSDAAGHARLKPGTRTQNAEP